MMMRAVTHFDDVFEQDLGIVDVTSNHRPDTAWRFTDAAGHEHRWFADGQPAESYRADARHEVPSLVWVKDGEDFYPGDDEPHDIGHHECRHCGEHVEPSYTADTNRVFIKGLTTCRINGKQVSKEEFDRRWKEAQG